jgi:hypothetical protein
VDQGESEGAVLHHEVHGHNGTSDGIVTLKAHVEFVSRGATARSKIGMHLKGTDYGYPKGPPAGGQSCQCRSVLLCMNCARLQVALRK